MIKGMDHIGIAVKDLDKSITKWENGFGFENRGIEEIPERKIRLAQMENTGCPIIELIASLVQDSPVEKFLEKRGEGIHHVCFLVDDIHKAVDDLKKEGMKFVQEEPVKGAEGSLIIFLHPRNINGVLIELKEKANK